MQLHLIHLTLTYDSTGRDSYFQAHKINQQIQPTNQLLQFGKIVRIEKDSKNNIKKPLFPV